MRCVTETLQSLEAGSHSFTTVSTFENTLRIANEQAKLVAWRSATQSRISIVLPTD
jgi:hypothetical protein